MGNGLEEGICRKSSRRKAGAVDWGRSQGTRMPFISFKGEHRAQRRALVR